MILTKHGNLLDAKGIIVHGCNAQGAFGSGVAGQIRRKWPEAHNAYSEAIAFWKACNHLPLGRITQCDVEDGVKVVHAITQEFYGYDGRMYVDYQAVRECFQMINYYYRDSGVPINFPKIGCGLAGGDWDIVSKIIDEELDDHLEKMLWVVE